MTRRRKPSGQVRASPERLTVEEHLRIVPDRLALFVAMFEAYSASVDGLRAEGFPSEARRRFTSTTPEGSRGAARDRSQYRTVAMTRETLRHLKGDLKWTQVELARRLGVPHDTYRCWKAVVRPIPSEITAQLSSLIGEERADHPVTLPELARELGIHVRTLRCAAKDGRLAVAYRNPHVRRTPNLSRDEGGWEGLSASLLQEDDSLDCTTSTTTATAGHPSELRSACPRSAITSAPHTAATGQEDLGGKQGGHLPMGKSASETVRGALATS